MSVSVKVKSLLALAVLSVFMCRPAFAHEFHIMPEQWNEYKSGQVVPVGLYSTHVFCKGEEVEDVKLNELIFDGQSIQLVPNNIRLSHDAAVTLKKPGAAVLAGHRKPILWSVYPGGEGEGGRDTHKNATSVTLYEKFAKALLSVDGKTDGFGKVVGHKLEIVPVDNPLTAKPGDEILFKVLLNGKPAMFDAIYATYDGFSDLPNAWAFHASPTSHGQARVRITQPGQWVVRVAVELDEKTAEHDGINLKATLTFAVK